MKPAIKLSRIVVIFTLFFLVIGNQHLNAIQKDSVSKQPKEIAKEKKKINNERESNETNETKEGTKTLSFNVSEKTVQIISISFFLIMLVLIILFFNHVRSKNQYLGFQSIKYIGLVLMFPGICILALVGGGSLISGSTLAALLGTIAGYVLSRDREDDSSSSNSNDTHKKENKKLKETIAKLTAELEKLKQVTP